MNIKWTVIRHNDFMSLPYAVLIDWWWFAIFDPIVERAVLRDIAKESRRER